MNTSKQNSPSQKRPPASGWRGKNFALFPKSPILPNTYWRAYDPLCPNLIWVEEILPSKTSGLNFILYSTCYQTGKHTNKTGHSLAMSEEYFRICYAPEEESPCETPPPVSLSFKTSWQWLRRCFTAVATRSQNPASPKKPS